MTETARAAVAYERNEPLKVIDVELGEVGPNDVLVRLEAASLCHSDVAVIDGTLPWPLPMILGHEGAGVVEAVGANVMDKTPGDHVVLAASLGCGRCRYCQKGRPTVCAWGYPKIFASVHPDGGFRARDTAGRDLHQFACVGTLAQRIVVHDSSAVKIDRDVPFGVAALIGCCVTTGVGAVINRAQVHPGASVAVIGCGGVGLNAVQGARICGATTIIAIDPIESKRDLAAQLGATSALDPAATDVVASVQALTGGVGADFAIECVGAPQLVRDAWNMIGIDGTVVAIGIARADDQALLPAQSFSCTEKTLMATTFGSARPHLDMPRFAELYQTGALRLDDLLTHSYVLDDINQAIADLEHGVSTKAAIALR